MDFDEIQLYNFKILITICVRVKLHESTFANKRCMMNLTRQIFQVIKLWSNYANPPNVA